VRWLRARRELQTLAFGIAVRKSSEYHKGMDAAVKEKRRGLGE
jgi:hypothetical protein